MDGNIFVSIFLGLFVPGIVSFVKNAAWPKAMKIALAVAVSVVVAGVQLVVEGGTHTVSDFLAQGAVIWATAQAFYSIHFQGTAFNAKLEVGGPFAG